jgi:CRP-like cAMP-binding protein
MALLTGEVRAADVVSLSDVVTLEIAKSSFEPILHNHPELAAAISHKIMQRLAQLASIREEEQEQEELTLVSRIKSYFGLLT